MKKISTLFLLLLSLVLSGQQGQQLFHMHYLGESNFLNPAVQSECKWFIGIPLLSSVHVNYANSAFSYRQLVENSGDTSANLQIDKVVDHLGRRSFLGTEIHINLLALGYKLDDYYFNFSIIEKNNMPFTASKDVFSLPWGGNTQFEGDEASSRGSSMYLTHYREYALGLSKSTGNMSFWGVKGKLLFGKLNISVPRANNYLYTDPSTFDLTISGDIRANLSAPLIINEFNDQPNRVDFAIDESVSPMQLIFNPKNWGLAFDAGFIQQLNERTSLSGSILDLGFIGWRSNLNNLTSNANFVYRGFLNDTSNIIGSILDSIDFDFTHEKYMTMLPTKLYLGIEYALSQKLDARALTSAVIYRTKLLSALTLGLDYNPFRNFHLVTSYSLMYRAFNIWGLGFSTGRGPVQFYMISDNVAGMIWPLSTRNINLRFGLNINLGCKLKEDEERAESRSSGFGNCSVYESPLERQKRMRKR